MSENATDMLAVEFDCVMAARMCLNCAAAVRRNRRRGGSGAGSCGQHESRRLENTFGNAAKVLPCGFPVVTGRDGAGEIMTVGGGAEAPSLASESAFWRRRGVGTWCDKLALPEAEAVPFRVSCPSNTPPRCRLPASAHGLPSCRPRMSAPGMRVLIHAAAGGVGSLAVQLARIRGAEVVATCSQSNVDFVRSLGAEAIAYDKTPFEDAVRDVDVVLDVIGGDVHRRSYRVLKRGGTIVCLVAAPFQDLGAQYGVKVMVPQVLSDPAALTQIVALVAAGKLQPCVEHVLPLADFAKAQQMSETGHARGKTVLML